MSDIITQLQRTALFADLSEVELMPIVKASRCLNYPAKTGIFNAGDHAEVFFVLLTGSVRLYLLNAAGKEKVIELIQPGHTFAEAVVFLQKNYPVYAETLEKSQVLAINGQAFINQLHQQPALALKVLASLSLRLHRFLKDIQTLSLENAEQRVAGFLLAMTHAELAQHTIPKATIASRLGLTPETFSRVLGRLKEQGVIAENAGELQVLQPAVLQQLREAG